MPRNPLAYLSDIVEACDAIAVTLHEIDLPAYEATRTLRSAVEREFTIIGEAVNSLARLDSELVARISHDRKIVGFRNQLVHDYSAIIDATVWAIANHDAPILRRECDVLLEELRRAD
jgi:uncharacterized protein with HEPN domain